MGRKKKEVISDKQDISSDKPKKDYSYLLPYQFKPGQSGNPAGRAVGAISLPGIIRKISDEAIDPSGMTRLEALIRKLFTEAIEGDQMAREMLFDRGWGTLIQKQQMNFDVTASLLTAAKDSNLDPNEIRADPILLAIFASVGVDPNRLIEDERVSAEKQDATIIDNPKTPNG